jgi:hypothetical protein
MSISSKPPRGGKGPRGPHDPAPDELTTQRKAVNRHFTRRRLLGGLGAATVLTPFVPLLEGQAETGSFPRRLVLLFSANGTLHERWAPSGNETDFTLPQILAPLESYKDKMIVLDGLRVLRSGPGDGHQMGMGCMWTGSKLLEGGDFQGGGDSGTAGWCGGISVDQEIANAIGQETPYKSLEFGIQCGGATVWSRMCYSGPNQPIAPEDNPSAMFDRLFADLGIDNSALERLKAERGSVIDLVKDDLTRLNTRASGSDRQKVEAHLDAIRAIETRNNMAPPVCDQPELDIGPDHNANANFPHTSKLQIQQLVMSLACDLTRVASLQWSRSVSNTRFDWIGVPEGHHDISHWGDSDPAMVDKITAINVWYAEEVKYLLDAMAAVPEGDGTLLDNSIVVWGNELSRGNSHGNRPVPFVIFGSGGGVLQTGRHLRYDDVAHNRFLVSLCNAMGLATQSFGDNDPGSGGLAGLT